MDRRSLLNNNKTHHSSIMDLSFITEYSNQYQQLESIIKKYWPILKEDRTLAAVLPNKPRFIYRKAPTLITHLVHNVLDPPQQVNICPDLKGSLQNQ